jgi:nickel-type superoxide dismutase maturation protease
MAPTLRHGDGLLARRVRRHSVLRPGDVVVARDPRSGRLVVKRAVRRDGAGWWLLGDNPDGSTDSRVYGAVPEREILARVVWRLRDPARVARVRGLPWPRE